jgi:hypothetical protein
MKRSLGGWTMMEHLRKIGKIDYLALHSLSPAETPESVLLRCKDKASSVKTPFNCEEQPTAPHTVEEKKIFEAS